MSSHNIHGCDSGCTGDGCGCPCHMPKTLAGAIGSVMEDCPSSFERHNTPYTCALGKGHALPHRNEDGSVTWMITDGELTRRMDKDDRCDHIKTRQHVLMLVGEDLRTMLKNHTKEPDPLWDAYETALELALNLRLAIEVKRVEQNRTESQAPSGR